MKRTHRGFTIIEVLVALVVLSVGLLGIAGLYVIALRAGTTSINRMQAVNLAADMADRIHANADGRE
jgi:type IV pilus assembly protein PilV